MRRLTKKKEKKILTKEEFEEQFNRKREKAIMRFKEFEPEEGYFLCFSGGKDSQTIYHLAKQAGVKFDAHYSVTSVDPPELIHFIKNNYPDVIFDLPRYPDGTRISMWNLIPKELTPPTRFIRYCCGALKESNGEGRLVVTGVRWAESNSRRAKNDAVKIIGKPKKTQKMADELDINYRKPNEDSIVFNDDNDEARRMIENCYRTRKTILNPIVEWEEEDVWYYLNNVAKVPHCCLYDEGQTRLGCIGCPMASEKEKTRELERYPKFKEAYIRAFERMLKGREEAGKVNNAIGMYSKKGNCLHDWSTAQDVYDFWIQQ